jgi:hypothetical protein
MELEEFQKIPAKKRKLREKTLLLDKEPVFVQTAWEGFDASQGEASEPMIYSTYVLSASDRYHSMCISTPNEKKALMTHEMMVGMVRAHGGKVGLPLYRNFLARAFTNPRTTKQAWINIVAFGLVVVMQAVTVMLSVMFNNLDWGDAFTTVIGAAYGYCVLKQIKKLRVLQKEKAEELRVEKDREEFDRIVGPLKEDGTITG